LESLKGVHSEDLDIDERMILKCILRKYGGRVDRDRLSVLVNTEMNLRVSSNAGLLD
jgi:hypothetical protein